MKSLMHVVAAVAAALALIYIAAPIVAGPPICTDSGGNCYLQPRPILRPNYFLQLPVMLAIVEESTPATSDPALPPGPEAPAVVSGTVCFKRPVLVRVVALKPVRRIWTNWRDRRLDRRSARLERRLARIANRR